MLKHNIGIFSKLICSASILLWILLGVSPFNVQPVQAASRITVDIPASNITPTLDGVCNPSEYSDATQVSITVGTNLTFPVYMKHTATDAYFCFGDTTTGLPLPNGGASSVTVYIDRNNDGPVSGNNGDDFGVWMPYASATPPFAAYWVTTTYNGADPGGWQAVKHQITGASSFWTVEFRISSQTLGGWNHAVGLALFYHWWSAPNDDYSWPANGIWAAPQLWAIANLATNSVNVGASAVVPTVDGQCSTPEYSDASSIVFNTSSGTATAYLKHSAADLYVCIHNLTVPAPGQQNSPNAALYIDRSGTGGNTPNANDLSFTITYSGTVLAGSGDGSGFTGPDPGGYTVALFPYSGGWDAEFRISGATIGNWYSRTISVAVAEQNVNFAGDNYAWPAGNSFTIPNTWGQADLINLGYSAYIPIVMR